MKRIKKLKLGLIVLLCFVLIMIIVFGIYKYMLSPIGNSEDVISLVIPPKTTADKVADILYDNKLIRNKNIFKLYIRINNKDNIKASTYKLTNSMSLDEIVDVIVDGNNYNEEEITITFREGLNIKSIAEIIDEKTDNSYDDVINKLKDKTYINSLIEKYWFITNDVLNENIYFPLEGYLFPDTYIYAGKSVAVEKIFQKMLDEMSKKLEGMKKDILSSKYSVHELLTMASIVELEGVDEYSRKNIASVFYNRIKDNASLGSDVTACYAFSIDIKECNDNVPYNTYNAYNTRGPKMNGRLPVGPISSPSLESINSSVYPENNDYYYFVADKYRKVYFMKTESEFYKVIKEIKERGDWPW